MEMHIVRKEKLFYICNKTKSPIEAEDGYEKWYAKNHKVKKLLSMSMTLEIIRNYSVIYVYPLPTKSRVFCPRPFMMEVMNYKFS